MAAQILNQAIDQRQAQAGSFPRFLGGKEGLENTVLEQAGYPAAFIADCDLDGRRNALTADGDGAVSRACIAGIVDQIDQDLQKLLRIAQNAGAWLTGYIEYHLFALFVQ